MEIYIVLVENALNPWKKKDVFKLKGLSSCRKKLVQATNKLHAAGNTEEDQGR